MSKRFLIAAGSILGIGLLTLPACMTDRPTVASTTTRDVKVKLAIPELGKVTWNRGFDAAVVQARELNKPLLTLFQEVPG